MKKQQFLAWGTVAAWMALIFFFSAQPGKESGALSGELTQLLLQVVQSIFSGFQIDPQWGHTLLRKSAHFFVYLVLGGLSANALRTSGISGWRRYGCALLFSGLYAASDEFHQSLVPGRGPSVWDVGIDSAGAAVGIWLYEIIFPQSHKTKPTLP